MSDQAREHDEIDKAFRAVISTPEGKRVLFWLLGECNVYQDAFSGDKSNATNYTLGRQSVGRRLLAKLDEIDPRFYPQLLLNIAEMRAMERAAASRAADMGEEDVEE